MKPGSVEKWGRRTATERYGKGSASGMRPAAANEPQFVEDQHGPGYDNDTSGWVKGDGKPYPHFDKHKGGR